MHVKFILLFHSIFANEKKTLLLKNINCIYRLGVISQLI